MKITQIVCTYPPYRGGIGNSAQTFAKLLSQKNSVLTLTPKYQSKLKSSSQIKYLNPLIKYGNAALIPQIFKYLSKTDIIYLHYPFFGTDLIIWFYKLINKKRGLIIHYHMDVFKLSLTAKILSLPSRLIANSLFKQADLITCFSLDYIKQSQVGRFFQKNPKKFKEIPFAIDTKKFFPATEKNKSAETKILFVGGLDKAHYFKGLNFLIESLSPADTNLKLNIVGEGEEKEKFKKKIKEMGLEGKINFLGSVSGSELPRIYQNHDFLVLPSIDKSEALGIVLLEALASGLPVIASKLPGVRKVFKEGEQGLLVAPGKVEELREKIIYLSKNKKVRQEMGKKARILAEEKYSLQSLKKNLNQAIKII